MRSVAILACILLQAVHSHGQDTAAGGPKQMRIIVPSVPGAGPDFIARLMLRAEGCACSG